MALIAGPNIQKPQTPLVDSRSDYEAYFTVVGQVAFNGTRSGPTGSLPTSTMPGRWIGMSYFDTTQGKMLYLQSVNPDVWITWSGSAFTSVPIPPPLTQRGDIYTRNATNDTRLPIGTQGQILTVNTSQATLLQWVTGLTTKGDLLTFSTAVSRLPVGTDGQVLTVSSGTATGLVWAAASAGGGWTMVSKATDEGRSNVSTLSNDSVLQFAISPGSVYRARGMIFYTTNALADFSYQWFAGGVSLGSRARILHWYIAPGTATPTFANNTNVGVQTSILGNSGGGCLQVEAVIDNSTATQFSLQWAQDASDITSTIVKAGSYLEYMVVT